MSASDPRYVDAGNDRKEVMAPVVETVNPRSLPHGRYYTPMELRKPFLISYCVFILTIFTLLQLIAAAYSGAPSLRSLIPRSAQDNCPPGATCAPAPGSWTNPNAKPTTPGAPAKGSWTNPTTQSVGWQPVYYFVGGYLPTLAAILLSTWWKSIFSKLKEMEPIYQLNKTTGTLTSIREAIWLSYTSAALPKVFFSSLFNRRWLTWFGSVNMLLIYICTAFASETVYITTSGSACHVIVHPTESTNNDCQMHLSMRRGLAWALGIVLFAMFVLVVFVILGLRRQVSGIYAEASSIVGVASLYQTLLGKGLISTRDITSESTLKGHGNIGTLDLVPTAYDNLSAQPQTPVKQSKVPQRHKSAHPISLAVFWLYIIAVLVMILYYRFVSKPGTNNHFEDFMDSQSFGIRFFMTCLGLAIKLYWGTVEKHLRSTIPYIAMASEGGTTADRSVLIRTPSHPFIGLVSASSRHHPLLGLITICAVLSEVLVITLNTVPFSISTAYIAFQLSVYISTGIIALMIVTVPLILIWQVRIKKKTVVKAPECIADALAMIDEDLCANFGDLRELDGKQRDQIVRSWDYKYLLEGQSHTGYQGVKIVAYRARQVG